MDTTGHTTPPLQATLEKPSPQGTSSPMKTTPSSHGTPSPKMMTTPLAAATTTNDKHVASSPASPGRGKMRENADGSRTPVATRDAPATTAQSDHTTDSQGTELSDSDRAMLEQSLCGTRRGIKVESKKIQVLVAQLHEMVATVRDEEGAVRPIRTSRGR